MQANFEIRAERTDRNPEKCVGARPKEPFEKDETGQLKLEEFVEEFDDVR